MVLNAKFKLLTAMEFIKSIPSAKREWKSKTPYEKWCCFYNCGKIACDFVRVPLFRENLNEIHWSGYLSFSYMILDGILSIYTLHYYTMRGEMLMGLPSTCLMFVFIGVCVFFFNQCAHYERT